MVWFKLVFPTEMVSLENFNWWWERNLPQLFHVVLKVSTSSQTALDAPYPPPCHHFSQFVLSHHLAPSVCVVSSPPLFYPRRYLLIICCWKNMLPSHLWTMSVVSTQKSPKQKGEAWRKTGWGKGGQKPRHLVTISWFLSLLNNRDH